MIKFFYIKLAWNSIRKNSRLYIPYILTGTVMCMMYYIISFLGTLPFLQEMKGGGTLGIILTLGSVVISVFSLVFLFYTNSFLIRQRNKELGLYNVLGMNKKNISYIMFWENMIITFLAVFSGLLAGMTLSKFAEISLFNMLNLNVTYHLSIEFKSLIQTVVLYGIIYLIILLHSVIKVYRSNPLELMQSSRIGEKPPRANWVLAVLGVLLLGGAYYLAVAIEEPLSALVWFLIAVILVIIGTYMLFIAGSVALCRILQKRKKYYYKRNHFVSISSMMYRMKRNGAGLASICILSTMVLVMISSTASLYIGAEDSLRTRYPKEIGVSVTMTNLKDFNEKNLSDIKEVLEEKENSRIDKREYRAAEVAGYLDDNNLLIDVRELETFDANTFDSVIYLQVLPLEDYNRIIGEKETLDKEECLIHCTRMKYEQDTISIAGGKKLKVKKVVDKFFADGNASMLIIPTVTIITADFNTVVEPVLQYRDSYDNQMMQLCWNYGFNMDTTEEEEIAESKMIQEKLKELSIKNEKGIYATSVECRAEENGDFYATYSGLFFLGIMLSIVFVFATVLIIYYKQISEGYEDRSRFEIMQKVGMTKQDIKRSINSQMLTVFFAPLITAGIHLAFAFPMLWRLLQMFNLHNMPLLLTVTVICFLIFGIFYVIIYKLTAGVYYKLLVCRVVGCGKLGVGGGRIT